MMKVAIAILVLVAMTYVCEGAYMDACSHTGVKSQDDSACVGANNNMLCNTDNKCECLDKYPGYNGGQTFGPAPDNLSCQAH